MTRQLSTSLSDAVLATTAVHSAMRTVGSSIAAALGFLMIAAAASIGVLRFGMDNPSIGVIKNHQYLSWLAKLLGTTLLAVGYHRVEDHRTVANAHLAGAIAVLLLHQSLSSQLLEKATELVSVSSVISILVLCIMEMNPFGIIGCAIYALAGLVIGVDGNLGGILSVDLFHYALGIGNIAFMLGFGNEQEPVFYKPRH